MKRSRFFSHYCLIVFFAVCLLSCSTHEYEITDALQIQTKGPKREYSIDIPFSFDNYYRKNIKGVNYSLSEKFMQCQIPEDTLLLMTTQSLAWTCMFHPMNCIYTAYNNPFKGIQKLFECSNAFIELAKREDAASAILSVYGKLCSQREKTQLPDSASSYEEVTGIMINFWEMLIGSGYIPSLFSSDNREELKASCEMMLSVKNNAPETYSYYSIACTIFVQKVMQIFDKYNYFSPEWANNLFAEVVEEQLSLLQDETLQLQYSSGIILGNTTIHTYFGKPIAAMYLYDYTAAEKLAVDAYWCQTYPNAVLLASSTFDYNCHYYAWNQHVSSYSCWVNQYVDGVSQLYKYYTDDLYVPATQTNADIISYIGGDHSALVSTTSGKYVSKWGSGPLMEHSPTDCPYMDDTFGFTYYTVRSTPKLDSMISGEDFVSVGSTYCYSASKGTTVWSMDYPHDNESYASLMSDGSSRVYVTYNHSGEFYLKADTYINNKLINSCGMTVLAVNE